MSMLRRSPMILGTVLVVLIAGVMIRLGVWQLHRLEERRSLNRERIERRSAPPLELPTSIATSDLIERSAYAAGRFLEGDALRIVNRAHNKTPGFDVASVFQLDTGERLLVNRGWAPLSAEGEPPTRLAGAMRIEGFLFVPLFDERDPHPPSLPANEWVRIDPATMGDALDLDLLPYALFLTKSVESTPFPRVRELPAIDEGAHLGYALQWFSFAAIGLIGWGALLRRGLKKKR